MRKVAKLINIEKCPKFKVRIKIANFASQNARGWQFVIHPLPVFGCRCGFKLRNFLPKGSGGRPGKKAGRLHTSTAALQFSVWCNHEIVIRIPAATKRMRAAPVCEELYLFPRAAHALITAVPPWLYLYTIAGLKAHTQKYFILLRVEKERTIKSTRHYLCVPRK